MNDNSGAEDSSDVVEDLEDEGLERRLIGSIYKVEHIFI